MSAEEEERLVALSTIPVKAARAACVHNLKEIESQLGTGDLAVAFDRAARFSAMARRPK